MDRFAARRRAREPAAGRHRRGTARRTGAGRAVRNCARSPVAPARASPSPPAARAPSRRFARQGRGEAWRTPASPGRCARACRARGVRRPRRARAGLAPGARALARAEGVDRQGPAPELAGRAGDAAQLFLPRGVEHPVASQDRREPFVPARAERRVRGGSPPNRLRYGGERPRAPLDAQGSGRHDDGRASRERHPVAARHVAWLQPRADARGRRRSSSPGGRSGSPRRVREGSEATARRARFRPSRASSGSSGRRSRRTSRPGTSPSSRARRTSRPTRGSTGCRGSSTNRGSGPTPTFRSDRAASPRSRRKPRSCRTASSATSRANRASSPAGRSDAST